ncbi:FtsX-like permease family protein [Chitinophaga costaii]|uniref:FtsX-like permease family protein n=1 Tax=Chitinophaga costaii TaxID=1335309 RepID=A0A1C4E2T6_9BACT|nr:ABC transporter permease [Chitinophaga costaii]PUZ24353.1 ABC transporter permease [Chitinophaga costaii]SCC37899.1 FtsX-like permease family protein [Chitinophaga costaii]
MFSKYLTIALRNLRNNKTYSFINITGMALSLAISILLLLWVNDELSYDRFNLNAANIYKLSPKFDDQNIWYMTPAPIAVYAKKQVPEVEDACRITSNGRVSLFEYNGKKFIERHNCLAEASLFTMFTFPFVKGNPQHPFIDASSIVLSETTAKTLFGDEDPMGKILKGDDKKLYTVTGIMKDMPANSTLHYNVVFNFQQLEQEYDTTNNFKTLNTNWDQYSFETYVLLKPNTSPVLAANKMGIIHRQNYDIPANKNLTYLLNPLTKLHLYALDGKEQGMMVVRALLMVAVIVLLIACINYVNLITARAIKRSKEISLRKIVGAGKAELFMQFLSESMITFLLALVLATGIIYLVMPLYKNISGKNIVFKPWSTNVLEVYGLTMLTTLLLAGIYPAITLSSFKPLEAMKGKLSGFGSKGNFRKVLVVVQFSFSILLITSTIIIGKQLKYIREKNLGYNKENVFSFWMRDMNGHYDAAVNELLKQPGISGVTESGVDIINSSSGSSDVDWDDKRVDQRSFTIVQMPIERNFIQVMGMQLVEGNGFTGSPADSANFILNETAIKAAGIKEPVIGKRLTFQGIKGVIAGVVKDFHFQDMHQKILPLLMQYNEYWRGKMYVRTTGKDARIALAAAEKIWKEYNADYTFEYDFLDKQFDNLYQSDTHVGQLFNCFALIAILISCLGLFGLVTFTAESKVKEIGVRKVLGAGVPQIVTLLSKDFLALVLVAAAITFPVAGYGLNSFLQGYAYRTNLSWWVFGAAGAITLFVAMLTVIFKCIQAALTNPVCSLRME